MDPNATLAEALDAARAILAEGEQADGDIADLGRTLAERFVALHEWFQADGFIPAAWASARHRFVEDAVYTGGPDAATVAALDKMPTFDPPRCGGSLLGGKMRQVTTSHGSSREVQCRGCNEWFPTVTGHVPPHPQSRAWYPGCDDGGYR